MIWPVLAAAVEEFVGPVEYEEPPPEETPSTEVVPGEEPSEEGPAGPPPFVPYRNRDAWLDAGTIELLPEDNEVLPFHFENWALWEGLDPGPWLGDWRDVAREARYYYVSDYEKPFDRQLMVDSYKAMREEEEFYAWEQERGLIPDIELGHDSDIKFEGRKLFSAGYSKTTYAGGNPLYSEGQPAGDITMEGELQLRIEGTVLRKTHVYVDYDDTRENDTRNQVSVVYKGDPDELVQEAAFGDIILSLPSTEFVSYSSSRAVFGAKVDLKYKWARMMAIASREKGETKRASFTGGTELTSTTVSDTGYSQRKFYLLNAAYDAGSDVTFFEAGNKIFTDTQGIPKVEIFLYQPTYFPQGITDYKLGAYEFDDNATPQEEKGEEIIPNSKTYKWRKLTRGEQYLVDVDSGVITFNTNIEETDYLAVAYVIANADNRPIYDIGYSETEPGSEVYVLNYNESNVFQEDLKCIKKSGKGGDLQRYELKNYYYLGSANIRSTSLVVKVLDNNDSENDPETEGRTYLYTLGLDQSPSPDGDGRVDGDFIDNTYGYLIVPDVDYKNGFARRDRNNDGYLDYLPFDYDGSGTVEFKDAYPPETESKRKFYVEYESLKPSYFLSLNIIPGSETVKLNGQVLVPNQDYWLDYDSGILSLLIEGADDPTSVLEVTYEYKPLFALLTKSLVGTRFQFGPDDDRYLGTTLIAEFSSKPPGDDIPKIEEAPVNHYIFDADAKYRFYPEIMTKIADAVPGAHTSEGSSLEVEAEFAKSYKDVNTVDKALIDDMEGARQLSTIPMSKEAWKYSSAPIAAGIDHSNRGGRLLGLEEEPEHRLSEVDPDWPADTLDLLRVYDLPDNPNDTNPNPPRPSRWGAIHRVLSPSGVDFTETRFEYVEIMLNLNGQTLSTDDDVNGGLLHLNLGTISEDADGNHVLGTEKLTDNGNLTTDNDVGYDFNNTDNQTEPESSPPVPQGYIFQRIDNKNVIDTEDNNRNLVLDTDDDYFKYTIDLNEVLDGSSPYLTRGPADPKAPLNAGWYILRVPLELDSAEAEGNPDATSVQVLRLWLEAEDDDDFPAGSMILLGTVSFSAMKWEQPVVSPATGLNEMKISTKDSRHDADYVPLRPVEDTETGTTEREQALVMEYVLTDWEDVGVFEKLGQEENGTAIGRTWGAGNDRYDTEDANHNGVLDPGEDIGVGPYGVGAGNGLLDEEPAPEASTRYTNYSGDDYSKYKQLDFYYFNRTPRDATHVNSINDIVFLRFGADEDNYYEYSVQMQPDDDRWIVVSVDLEEFLRIQQKGQPFISADLPIHNGHYRIVGDPSLLNIVEIRVGMRTKVPEEGGSGGFLDYREVWINDIMLLDPDKQLGQAWRASTSLDFGNFVKVNVGARDMGAGFEEIGTTSVATSTTTSKNADTTVELSKFMPDLWNVRMPLSGGLSKMETITEEKYDPQRSIYSQGKTIAISRNIGISFSKYKLPSLNFKFANSDSVNYKYARTYEADTYSGGMDYDIYPRKRYLPVNVRSNFDRRFRKTRYDEKGKEDTGTDWVTDDSRSSIKFEPIEDLEITPSYDYSYTRDRVDRTEESFDESYGMKVNYFRVKGLRPGTSYTSSYREIAVLGSTGGGGGADGPTLAAGQTLDLSLSTNYNFTVPVDIGKLTDERAHGINKWSITPSYDLVRSSSYTGMTIRAPSWYRLGRDFILPEFTDRFVNSRRRYTVSVNNRFRPLEFMSYRTGTQWENWDFIQTDFDFSYSNELADSGSPYKLTSTTFPDVTCQLYGTKNFPLVAAYLERSTVVVSYTRRKNYRERSDIVIQQRPGISWRATWSRNFRTRADYDYTHTTTQELDPDTDLPTDVERILKQENPSLTVYYDLANPKGFKLPLLGTLRWRNELNLSAGVALTRTRGIEAEQDDTDQWDYTLSGGYTITTNLRADVSGSIIRYSNLTMTGQDYVTVGVRGDFEISF
ncbi:MAG: hypothetical protein PVH29_11335 [Candidatus Zixiibacteriota bacterium]